ncbi:MAG: dUTP diphosphatase [Elusimicrobia bacterium]|nr:dUTP diphosphatase [Elusimicrobiota bacterium]
MTKPLLKIQKVHSAAILPGYAHPGDAGLDLHAVEAATLPAGKSGLVRTGLKVELPRGTEAQIRPRSGLALKSSVTVLNSPGTIDEGYRGEVGVILINHGQKPFAIAPGMRIAQLVVNPVLTVRVKEVPRLSESHRASGGFGSTGR